MTKMTMNECMLEAIPLIKTFAEGAGDTKLLQFCQQLETDSEQRLALWCFMIAWCAEFDGVAQQLQKSSAKLVVTDAPIVANASTLH